MAMGAYRGRRNKDHGGAAEVPAASSSGDPARVRREAAETHGSKAPEDQGPGSRIPVRKVVLVMVGVARADPAYLFRPPREGCRDAQV
jgi:hypothetical protein